MLFKLVELSDLYADACVRDESGNLMFLSLYGRDTAIKQFLAALTLKEGNGGLDSFKLSAIDAGALSPDKVFVGNADRLKEFSGRLPKDNLFGNLVHTWIYDPALVQPDRSNKTGWLMVDEAFTAGARGALVQGIWSLYKTLSPVPLLDSWMEMVIRATKKDCVSFMQDCNYPPIGAITAARVTLQDTFPGVISSMVKAGMIGLNGEERDYLEQARKGREATA